jgi:hypothetical protein
LLKEGRFFFFEKKKQKTFGRAVAGVSGDGATAEQKFFGSFLQKRTFFNTEVTDADVARCRLGAALEPGKRG